VTTGGTTHRPYGRGCGLGRIGRIRVSVSGRCGRVGGLRGELGAQGKELLTVGGTEEAIIAHLDQALGQDVLQETVDELLGRQRAELGLAGVGFVAERDLVVLHLDDAAIAQRRGNVERVGAFWKESDVDPGRS
jgi:hypothetical protein